ncbi:MAG: hypothetical protein ACO3XO_04605 [Bdellovibrionota bacterium]
MSDHVLTIQRILTDGAIAKTVTCRSGRIAVLRSHAPEKLYEYELALRGKLENPSMFRLMFNGAAYDPTQPIFIGFDKIQYRSEMTVRHILTESGVGQAQLEGFLSHHGIQQIAEKPLQELSPEQAQSLSLLQVSLQPFPLIVMNDPFLPIPEEYREMYAHTLANGIWKNKGIGIVVSLSWRPESWIDNDLITRVQIDQTSRRATVGIGSENPLTELAKQIRQEKQSIQEKREAEQRAQEQEGQSTKSTVMTLPKTPTKNILKNPLFRLSALSVIFISVSLLILWDQDTLSNTSNLPNESNAAGRPTQEQSQNPVQNVLVLDAYPGNIRDGILAAFAGEASLSTDATLIPTTIQDPEVMETNTSSNGSRPLPPLNTSKRTTSGNPQNPLISLRDLSQLSNNDPSPSRPTSTTPSIMGGNNMNSFQSRMEKLMEGKDPATQERIKKLIERMKERAAERDP